MKPLCIPFLLLCAAVHAQKLPDRLELAIKDSLVLQKTYDFSFRYQKPAMGWYRFTNSSASMKPYDVYVSGDKYYYNEHTPAFMNVLQQPQLIVTNPAVFDPQKLFSPK